MLRVPSRARPVVAALVSFAAVASVTLLAGCSSSGSSAAASTTTTVAAPPLLLDAVAPAVAAVESALGGPQQYTEINVQSDLVNLFVAHDDGTESAYVYTAGRLDPPPAPTPQEEGAVPFSVAGVDLSTVSSFDDTLATALPHSQLVRLALRSEAATGLAWAAALRSSGGGILEVLLSPSGAILGALPR